MKNNLFVKTALDIEALKGVSLKGKDVTVDSKEQHVHDLLFVSLPQFTMRGLCFRFHHENEKMQCDSLVKIGKAIADSPTPPCSLRLWGVMLPLPQEFMELAGPHIQSLFLNMDGVNPDAYLNGTAFGPLGYTQAFRMDAFSHLKYFSFKMGLSFDLVKDAWFSQLIDSLHGKNLIQLFFDVDQEENKFPLSTVALSKKLSQCPLLTRFSADAFFEVYNQELGQALSKMLTLKDVSLKGKVDSQFVKDVIPLPHLRSFHCMETDCPEQELFPFMQRWKSFSWNSLETSTLALLNPENLKQFNLRTVQNLDQFLWIARYFIPRFSSKLRRFQIQNFAEPNFVDERQQGMIDCLNALHQNKKIEQLFLHLPWTRFDERNENVQRAMERLVSHSFAVSYLMHIKSSEWNDFATLNLQYWIKFNAKRKVIARLAKETSHLNFIILRTLCLSVL